MRKHYLFWLLGLLTLIVVAGLLYDQISLAMRLLIQFGLIAPLLCLIFWRSGLSFDDVGLAWQNVGRGVTWGLTSALLIALVLSIVFLITPDVFRDPRYHAGFVASAMKSLLLLPLVTVVFEEFVFRGLLFGLAQKLTSIRSAVLLSSGMFGLWHLLSAGGVTGAANSYTGKSFAAWLVIVGVVLVTFGAGLLLCWLRLRSRSLLSPMLAHWAVNGVAILLASFAWAM